MTDLDESTWKGNALCFQLVDLNLLPADLWFQGDFTEESKDAAGICFQCPVRDFCLKQACKDKEAFGVWGGLPTSIRIKKGRTHNYTKLRLEPNPYDTDRTDSPYHPTNLAEGQNE